MLAPDGYIRMTFTDFCTLSLKQNLAWPDTALLEELRDLGVCVESAGYCEWAGERTIPRVSLGWAWVRHSHAQPPVLAPGGISSNVMLRNPYGYDLGAKLTEELLASWLQSQPWQGGVPHTC
ncbi:DUF4902 domain-containing protein [Pseudomonas mandelii]|uniref:DUF4902 domain-containing protein n=1 Tax=Pseudomonas mandelii TaxID=75612 RepID=A0A502IC57_9PSED|nr:DUF4902 domain-containing protein [Pseudomonas mandelii]